MSQEPTRSRQRGFGHIIALVIVLLLAFSLPLAVMIAGGKRSVDPRSKATLTETTLSFPVLLGTDDAIESADANRSVTLGNTTIAFGWPTGATGIRFHSLALSALKNAVIQKAYIEVRSSASPNNDIRQNIYFEKSDNCKTFEPVQANISSRPKTTASVPWNLKDQPWTTTGNYKTPDIKELISEVTSSPSWAGKNLCAILTDTGSDKYQTRSFWAKDGGVFPPTLVVKFISGQITPSPLPTAPPSPLPTAPTSPSPAYATPTPIPVSPIPTLGPSPMASFPTPTTGSTLGVRTAKKGAAGIVYPDALIKSPPLYEKLGNSWFYSWHAEPQGLSVAQRSCREFVPMLNWKGTEEMAKRLIVNYNRRGLYWLIGNEPDIAGSQDGDGYHDTQENLLSLYVRLAKKIKTLDPTAKLILGGFANVAYYTSTSQSQPSGYNFARLLKDRLLNEGIRPNGWHIHMYNCCNFDNFRDSLRLWKSWQNTILGGGETWITEFGALQAKAGTSEFMTATINFMENTSDPNYYVDRYAWFYILPWNNIPHFLSNSDGTLTSFGRLYAGLPSGRQRPTSPLCQQ